MKILFIVDSLAIGGGAERVTTTLGNELYRRGYGIYYLTFFDENPKYDFKGEYFTFNQGKIQRNLLKRMVDLMINPIKIKKICEEKKIDTIISVGEVANIQSVLSKYIFKNRSKIIISQHINPEIHIKNKIKVSLIGFLYSKADEIVCVSKDTERILKEDFKIADPRTIYNMQDIEDNIRLSRENLPRKYQELFRSGFKFINVGRLSKQKGQWFLIKSLRKVVDKHENAKLLILGGGELKTELNLLIKKLDLENNVFLLGNQENVFSFLKNSDCFVFSSLWEGFPMTLIEALSLNIPIISTDCRTGPRETLCPELGLEEEVEYPYFGEYGILTMPMDSEPDFGTAEDMLAHLMERMMEDGDLREKYSNGLRKAEELDKAKIVREWERVLV